MSFAIVIVGMPIILVAALYYAWLSAQRGGK